MANDPRAPEELPEPFFPAHAEYEQDATDGDDAPRATPSAPDADGVYEGSGMAPAPAAAAALTDGRDAVRERAMISGSREAAPRAGDEWTDADGYLDIPASLELSYTAADLGLTPGAYDRAIPYDDVPRRRRPASGTRVRRVGRELVETVILALLIFFAVKAVVQNFRVEGSSMEPSLQSNEYLLVNKAIYFRVNMDKVHDILPFIPGDDGGQKRHLFRPPRRGDVIVFKYPGDTNRDFIKRVIGVPGDTVEVKEETVFVNGSPLKEDYVEDTPNYTYGPKTVPPNSYFVLGDNRRNSFDSHAWGQSCAATQQCDFVPEENIIGQAWVAYWPRKALGFVNNKVIKPVAQ